MLLDYFFACEMDQVAEKIIGLLEKESRLWVVKIRDPRGNGSYENKFVKYIKATSKEEAWSKLFQYLLDNNNLDLEPKEPLELMIKFLIEAKRDNVEYDIGGPCYPMEIVNFLKDLSNGKEEIIVNEELIHILISKKEEIIKLLKKYSKNLTKIKIIT